MRIGFGYDVHRLVPGRRCVLCGVEIPSELGLLGHSDADAAAHALIDALLGAAALGDIGRLYPDTDEAYKDVDSMVLLRDTVARVRAAGYEIGNADITIVAQAPRIAPYVEDMRRCLAENMGVDVSRVSVKGKTEEGLGFTGTKQGIAVHAAALIQES